MSIKTIEAQEVRVGDRIYNSHAFHPCAAWISVKSIERQGDCIVLHTSAYDDWRGHPRAATCVMRDEESA